MKIEDYNKYYIQNSDHYLIPKDVFNELFVEMINCREETKELKKQLENKNKQIEYLRRSIERKEDTIIDLQNETIPYTNEYVCKLETQQKEFIEYLENEIYSFELRGTSPEYNFENVLKIILLKYKEIIGDDK